MPLLTCRRKESMDMWGTKDIHSLLTINIRLCLPLSSTVCDGGPHEFMFIQG